MIISKLKFLNILKEEVEDMQNIMNLATSLKDSKKIISDLKEDYDVVLDPFDEKYLNDLFNDISSFIETGNSESISTNSIMWLVSKVFDLNRDFATGITIKTDIARHVVNVPNPFSKQKFVEVLLKVLRLADKETYIDVQKDRDLFSGFLVSMTKEVDKFVGYLMEEFKDPTEVLKFIVEMMIGEYNDVEVGHPTLGQLNLTPEGAGNARSELRTSILKAIAYVMRDATNSYLSNVPDWWPIDPFFFLDDKQ